MSNRGTPAGIKLVITVLICAILILFAAYYLFDGRINNSGTITNSSSSSQRPDNSSSSSSSEDSSSSDEDAPGGDTPGGNTPGGNTPDGDTPGGDHLKGKATLNRVELKGYRLEGGTMVAFTNNSTVDFSNVTSENLFGIREDETFAPGCKYEATMTLSNDGDFALDYWMEVRMTSGFNTALAEQLKVTLTVNGIEYSTTVGQPMGDPRAPLGEIKKGETITFTISVEFIEHENNNAAQGQTVTFDLYVTTSQKS